MEFDDIQKGVDMIYQIEMSGKLIIEFLTCGYKLNAEIIEGLPKDKDCYIIDIVYDKANEKATILASTIENIEHLDIVVKTHG